MVIESAKDLNLKQVKDILKKYFDGEKDKFFETEKGKEFIDKYHKFIKSRKFSRFTAQNILTAKEKKMCGMSGGRRFTRSKKKKNKKKKNKTRSRKGGALEWIGGFLLMGCFAAVGYLMFESGKLSERARVENVERTRRNEREEEDELEEDHHLAAILPTLQVQRYVEDEEEEEVLSFWHEREARRHRPNQLRSQTERIVSPNAEPMRNPMAERLAILPTLQEEDAVGGWDEPGDEEEDYVIVQARRHRLNPFRPNTEYIVRPNAAQMRNPIAANVEGLQPMRNPLTATTLEQPPRGPVGILPLRETQHLSPDRTPSAQFANAYSSGRFRG